MPIAAKLSQFIDQKGVMFQSLHHPRSKNFAQAIELANAIPELCAKCIPLIDKSGPVVAVIPYLTELNLDLVNETFNRQLQVLSASQAEKLFKDCESGALPALAMAYGLPVLVDIDMLESDYIFSASGCASTLLKIPGKDFRTAMSGAIKGRISIWPEVSQCDKDDTSELCSKTISLELVARKLERLYQLPPMPETAVKIMHLLTDPDADVLQLSELIERDPSLSAQVMRYARSALFNYRGELTCIKDAVNIVLGVDRVSQLAMGIAASKAFNMPKEGPLGLNKFWTHALYTGVLSQALALLANPDLLIDEKDAYLAGLLHNFGVLLIGHIFPPEFKMLNKLRESDPESSMREIEQQVFGMGGAQEFISLGHGSIGGILLKMWGMPESTVKTAAMHQNMYYEGSEEQYVWVTQLANHYLSEQGIGDEMLEFDPSVLLLKLGIQAEKAEALVEAIIEQCHSLDGMIQHMAA